MITIGEREVAFQTTLFVPDGEIAKIQVNVGDWKMPIEVSFTTGDGPRPSVTWRGEGEILKMIFEGFLSNIVTVTQGPSKIGVTDAGKNVGFIALISKHGKINRVELQLLLGGIYE